MYYGIYEKAGNSIICGRANIYGDYNTPSIKRLYGISALIVFLLFVVFRQPRECPSFAA